MSFSNRLPTELALLLGIVGVGGFFFADREGEAAGGTYQPYSGT